MVWGLWGALCLHAPRSTTSCTQRGSRVLGGAGGLGLGFGVWGYWGEGLGFWFGGARVPPNPNPDPQTPPCTRCVHHMVLTAVLGEVQSVEGQVPAGG